MLTIATPVATVGLPIDALFASADEPDPKSRLSIAVAVAPTPGGVI